MDVFLCVCKTFLPTYSNAAKIIFKISMFSRVMVTNVLPLFGSQCSLLILLFCPPVSRLLICMMQRHNAVVRHYPRSICSNHAIAHWDRGSMLMGAPKISPEINISLVATLFNYWAACRLVQTKVRHQRQWHCSVKMEYVKLGLLLMWNLITVYCAENIALQCVHVLCHLNIS